MSHASPSPSPVGAVLRQWREQRRLSQMALANEAGISTRHLSFVETGRSQPSRQTLLLLSQVLDVPPRARNELLVAAGFAPAYRETALDAPETTDVRRAVDLMLRQQEPFPAIALDRAWNITLANGAMTRLLGAMLDPASIGPAPNAMQLVFDPEGLRPAIVNWAETASSMIQWLHRDLLRTDDAGIARLIDTLMSYPDVPREWRRLAIGASTAPFLPLVLAHGDLRLSFFTVLATLGSPYDITLNELRVESFYPADAATEAILRDIAAAAEPAAGERRALNPPR